MMDFCSLSKEHDTLFFTEAAFLVKELQMINVMFLKCQPKGLHLELTLLIECAGMEKVTSQRLGFYLTILIGCMGGQPWHAMFMTQGKKK